MKLEDFFLENNPLSVMRLLSLFVAISFDTFFFLMWLYFSFKLQAIQPIPDNLVQINEICIIGKFAQKGVEVAGDIWGKKYSTIGELKK